jgi:large subunit ribosomal protein L10
LEVKNMPNAQILDAKKAVVKTLTQKLGSVSGVLVDYAGITVAEDTEMRARLRAESIDYTVVKNTLLRFAVKNAGLDALEGVLTGTTSLAVSASDAVAPARLLKEYATKFEDHFFIKGGFMDGKVLTAEEVGALADIPPLPMLRAQLLGTMLAPISMLAAVIKAIAEKESGGDTAPEETAAEAVAETPEEAPVEAAAEATAEAAEATAQAPEEAPAEAAGDAPVAEDAAQE